MIPIATFFLLLILTCAANISLLTDIAISSSSYSISDAFDVVLNQKDNLGNEITATGDINGDSISDIIVTANSQNMSFGFIYVLFGGKSDTINLETMKSTDGIKIFCEDAVCSRHMVEATVTTCDINADKYSDIVIGLPNYNNGEGIIYIIFGNNHFHKNIDLQKLTPSEGITISYPIGTCQGCAVGRMISTGGDINNDHIDDLIFTMRSTDRMMVEVPPTVLVGLYGRPNFTSIALESMNFSATQGFMITYDKPCPNCLFATSLDFSGDINGDGYDDIAIGAFLTSDVSGNVFIVYGTSHLSRVDVSSSLAGATGSFLSFATTPCLFCSFGQRISTAGDMNHDGYDDLVISAPGFDESTGIVFVIYGDAQLPTLIDMSDFSTTEFNSFGYVISYNTTCSGCSLGYAINTQSDINNDGITDMILSARGYNFGSGIVYILYGRTNTNIYYSTPLTFGNVILNGQISKDWLVKVDSSSSGGPSSDKTIAQLEDDYGMTIYQQHPCIYCYFGSLISAGGNVFRNNYNATSIVTVIPDYGVQRQGKVYVLDITSQGGHSASTLPTQSPTEYDLFVREPSVEPTMEPSEMPTQEEDETEETITSMPTIMPSPVRTISPSSNDTSSISEGIASGMDEVLIGVSVLVVAVLGVIGAMVWLGMGSCCSTQDKEKNIFQHNSNDQKSMMGMLQHAVTGNTGNAAPRGRYSMVSLNDDEDNEEADGDEEEHGATIQLIKYSK